MPMPVRNCVATASTEGSGRAALSESLAEGRSTQCHITSRLLFHVQEDSDTWTHDSNCIPTVTTSSAEQEHRLSFLPETLHTNGCVLIIIMSEALAVDLPTSLNTAMTCIDTV